MQSHISPKATEIQNPGCQVVGYLFIFGLFLFLPASLSANTDILVSSNVEYVYSSSGQCSVTHHLTLTNGPTHVYASSYQMDLVGPAPEDISVTSASGPLKFHFQEQSALNSRLIVYFSSPVVGKGSSQQFSISYRCPPAFHKGQIWEINLPLVNDIKSFESYKLTVQIPDNFGYPAFIDPSPYAQSKTQIVFSKSHLKNSPVRIVLGQFHIYSFSITYPLVNPESKDQTFYVPLPPDTSYQKIHLDRLHPLPKNVITDNQGNWIAEIDVKPRKRLSFQVKGMAYILPDASPLSLPPDQPLPQREVLGYGDNQLMSWQEKWDPSQFTWEVSNFLPNRIHIAAQLPHAEKLLNDATISMTAADFQSYDASTPQLVWQKPLQILPLIENTSQLVISNPHPQAIYWLPVAMAVSPYRLTSSPTSNISIIPPYGQVNIDVRFRTAIFPDSSSNYLSVRVGNDIITYNIPIYLFIIWYAVLVIFFSSIFLIVAWLTVRSWSLHIQRLAQQNYLRRQSQESQK